MTRLRARTWLHWLAVGAALALPGCGVAAPEHARTEHSQAPMAYTPRQLRVGYGIQPLVDRGIDGRGRMVVITAGVAEEPSSADRGTLSDLRRDLAAFDRRFGLPTPELTVNVPDGARGAAAYEADSEEVLDVEMVHAIAPGAALRVLLIPGQSRYNGTYLIDSLRHTLAQRRPADVISFSYAMPEGCLSPPEQLMVHALLRQAASRHITVVASSGDSGPVVAVCNGFGGDPAQVGFGVALPASDPLVTSVGGTRLRLEPPTGTYSNEVAWNEPPTMPSRLLPTRTWDGSWSSSGGYSRIYEPGYEHNPRYPARELPDVAASADRTAGLEIFTGRRDGGTIPSIAAGTSASAPLWAGLIAIADQYAHRRLGYLNAGLNRIGHSPSYPQAFHDITSGNNTVRSATDPNVWGGYKAAPGWDPVTGWGSPNAINLIPLLATAIRPLDGKDL